MNLTSPFLRDLVISSLAFLAVLTSRLFIQPRYVETDATGFVAADSYLPWLESGRAALLKEQGFSYQQLERDGYFVPIVEFALTLHQPAFYDDGLWLTTILRSRPLIRLRLDYELHRGEALLATAQTVQVFVNRQFEPVRPPAAFQAKANLLFP